MKNKAYTCSYKYTINSNCYSRRGFPATCL